MTRPIERAASADKTVQRGGLTLDMVVELTGYSPAEIALISKTVAVDAPLQELAVFLHAMRALKLDPLLRQGYWIRRGQPPKGTLQVGIDGFRAIAERTGYYAGSEPPAYSDWQQIPDGKTSDGKMRVPGVARVLVWKIVAGHKAAFHGEAAWPEFYPGPGPVGAMWRKMPRHMLAKVAEAQALRKAFPALLAAVNMAEEEGEDGPYTRVEAAEPRKLTGADYTRIYGTDEPEAPVDKPASKEAAPPAEEAPDAADE